MTGSMLIRKHVLGGCERSLLTWTRMAVCVCHPLAAPAVVSSRGLAGNFTDSSRASKARVRSWRVRDPLKPRPPRHVGGIAPQVPSLDPASPLFLLHDHPRKVAVTKRPLPSITSLRLSHSFHDTRVLILCLQLSSHFPPSPPRRIRKLSVATFHGCIFIKPHPLDSVAELANAHFAPTWA